MAIHIEELDLSQHQPVKRYGRLSHKDKRPVGHSPLKARLADRVRRAGGRYANRGTVPCLRQDVAYANEFALEHLDGEHAAEDDVNERPRNARSISALAFAAEHSAHLRLDAALIVIEAQL